MPQGLTKFESVKLARPDTSETRLVTAYSAAAGSAGNKIAHTIDRPVKTMILHEILNFLVMVIPPPATLVIIVSLREGTKKPRRLIPGNPAICQETRGFPPPPRGEFGFSNGYAPVALCK